MPGAEFGKVFPLALLLAPYAATGMGRDQFVDKRPRIRQLSPRHLTILFRLFVFSIDIDFDSTTCENGRNDSDEDIPLAL
jgi:hypothetical protein